MAKSRVRARFRRVHFPSKVMAAILVWAVVFGSKFLVLEAVNVVFGDRVSLGGFLSVSRAAVRRLLQGPYQPT